MIRVFLVDDHEIVRRGLHDLLALEPDFDVVGEAGSGAEALHLLANTPVDLVLLDIAMPGQDGLEVLQQFIGPEPPGGGRSPRRPLQASNATSLAQYIQWASTAVVGAASMPASRVQAVAEGNANIPLPDLPPTLLDPTDDVGPLVW